MVGGEHLKERLSERYQNLNNQPKQRGYEVGCHLRGGNTGLSKASYSIRTLEGNWYEEQFDSKFDTDKPVLVSSQDALWQTTYSEIDKRDTLARQVHQTAGGQEQLVKLVDAQGRVFPGHQPELDPMAVPSKEWSTETRSTYENPANTDKPLRTFGWGRAPSHTNKVRSVIHQVREKILQRTKGTFTGLRRSLKIMDSNGNNRLNQREVKEGLELYGVSLDEPQLKTVFKYFDKDDSGEVSLEELLRGVRGDMNQRRMQLVLQAYGLLDQNKDGAVKLDDIAQLYDVTNHPEVVSGKKTKTEVLRGFMAQWDANGDDYVTKEEFIEYYNDLSANIDSDSYFELMMRNTWHISGGTGKCANTSCRRVLVIRTNGRQSVEEIKNDLGIGPNDIDKMMANLAAQGIKDVARIELKQ